MSLDLEAFAPPSAVTDLRDGVRAAIEMVYLIFHRYPARHPVVGSPLSVSPTDQALLASAPLRQLSPHALSRYAFKALTSWGDADDYRHFLPRLLELAALDPHPELFIDIGTLFQKLDYAHWRDWPRPEQQALLCVVEALWPWGLSRWPSPLGSVSSFIEGLCHAVDDLGPYLKRWRDRGDPTAVLALAELVNYGRVVRVRRGKLVIQDLGLPSLRQVGEWLLEPDTGARMEQACSDHAGQPWSSDLALAVARLEGWAHTPVQLSQR